VHTRRRHINCINNITSSLYYTRERQFGQLKTINMQSTSGLLTIGHDRNLYTINGELAAIYMYSKSGFQSMTVNEIPSPADDTQ